MEIGYLEKLILKGFLVDREVLALSSWVILVQSQLHVAILHTGHLGVK
jgi:hypothetical protein